jgi:histidyl-tRNA synthetase
MQTWPQPVKVTLTGPMFRYDRPQAGRYRQFWQWDVEAIGDPGPAVDAEIIELGARFYREAGLDDVELLLNSIGDPACRPGYVEALTAYFRRHVEALPEVERARLATNPLRLLDSKDPAMAPLVAAAPKSADHLCAACAEHFAAVRAHLDAVGVAYRIEPTLVRGLDYYARTAFEYYRRGAEGQQQALGGGGRYDGLVELLGGKPTPGIGFAIGLDRVVLALEAAGADPVPEAAPIAVVVGADPADTAGRFAVATRLRGAGLAVRADLSSRKLGRQLEGAVRDGAHFAVILGDELAAGDVQLRDLDAASQKLVALDDLEALLRRKALGG